MSQKGLITGYSGTRLKDFYSEIAGEFLSENKIDGNVSVNPTDTNIKIKF